MKLVGAIVRLAEEFSDRIDNSKAEPAAWEPQFRAECANAYVTVEQVCKEQSDETLAFAIGRSCCLNECFVELLCYRYGDKQTHWFRRHASCYGRLIDPERTNDLLQELWFRLLNGGLQTFDARRSFAEYLFVATRNLFVSQVLRVRVPAQLDAKIDLMGEGAVLQEVEGREAEERIRQLLRELPAQQRQVIELTMQGYSSEEIARAISTTVKVMYRLRFQARRALEERLGR